MKNKIVTYIVLGALVLSALLFFILGMNESIGIVFLILAIVAYIFNNSKWGDKFKEQLGIGIFSGLIVSLARDIFTNSLNPKMKTMYFLGLSISILLLMKNASKGENI